MSLFSYNGTSATTSTGMKYTFGTAQSNTKPSSELNSASTNSVKINPYDYAPKRFGCRYDPPTIILEYLIPSSGKLYHHKMKILNLKPTSDTNDVLESLKKKHSTYIVNNKVCEEQITSLIEKLKKNVPKRDVESDSKAGNKVDLGKGTGSLFNGKPSYTSSNQDKDSNNSKSLTLGNVNMFGKIAPIASNKNSSPSAKKFWDDEEDGSPNMKPISGNLSKNQPQEEKPKANSFWDLDEEDDADNIDYNTVSLNKLTTEELSKHKKKMDVLFAQNQKKPGDPGFVYDLQEEFEPQLDNEWDEDIEEDDM